MTRIPHWTSLLLSIATMFAAEARPTFPSTPVEHTGKDKTDILHCLNENESKRQFCKVGWGTKFDQLSRLKVKAPSAYATELLIPNKLSTVFGEITAEKVLARLRGSLWTKWRIYPELQFMLEWSHHPDCWQKNRVLFNKLNVRVAGRDVGNVHPGEMNYNFPLTTPLGEELWQSVSSDSGQANRVQWRTSNSLAIHSEFDFEEPSVSEFGFSSLVIPRVCQINLYNVQTVVNREAASRAVERMESESRLLMEQLTTDTLLYASRVQGSDAVKCVLASQLSSLKKAEKLPVEALSRQLSRESQQSLREALDLTAGVAEVDIQGDPLEFLDHHQNEWEQACMGTTTLDAIEYPNTSGASEAANIARLFLRHREVLLDLFEDAWALSVVLQQINNDNRELQWLIDATIKYRLQGR